MRPIAALALIPLVLSSAAVAREASAQKPAPPPVGAPLAPWAGNKVALTPAQSARADTTWARGVDTRATLRALDDSLAAALTDAGLDWSPASVLVRAARRNVAYAGDPSTLMAQSLRRVKVGDALPPAFADRLRNALAFTDARFALVPVELQLPGTDPKDAGRLTLFVALVDARAQLLLWSGLVRLEPAAAFTPADVGTMARKLIALAGTP